MDSNPVLYSRYEASFAEWARAGGWSVTKQGWPDFLCRRGDEVMAVEVKGGNDGLSSYQHAAIRTLRVVGLPTYVWSPESGLRDVGGPIGDSVASLHADNVRLRRMLADALNLSMRVNAVPVDPVKRLRWSDEEARILAELSERCRARHPDHRSERTDEKLTLCAWFYKMREVLTVEEMAEISGLDKDQVVRVLATAIRHGEMFMQQQTAMVTREPWVHSSTRSG